MMGPRWIATLCATFAFAVLALGQSADETKIIKVTQNGRDHECKLLNLWMDENGSMSYLVQDLRTGEQFTVIETAPPSDRIEPEAAQPTGYDTVPKMVMRVFGVDRKQVPASETQDGSKPIVRVSPQAAQSATPRAIVAPPQTANISRMRPVTANAPSMQTSVMPKPAPQPPMAVPMPPSAPTSPVATQTSRPLMTATMPTPSMIQGQSAMPAQQPRTSGKPSQLPAADSVPSPTLSRIGAPKSMQTGFREPNESVTTARVAVRPPMQPQKAVPKTAVNPPVANAMAPGARPLVVSTTVPAKSVSAPVPQSSVVQTSAQSVQPVESKGIPEADASKSVIRRMIDVPEAEKARQAERQKAAKEGKVEQEESLWYGFTKVAGGVQKRISKGLGKTLEAMDGSPDKPLVDRKKTTEMPPVIELPGRDVEDEDPLMNPTPYSRDRLKDREDREKKEREKIEKSLQSKAPVTANGTIPKVRGAKPYEYSDEISVRPTSKRGKPRRLGIISIDAREPNAFSPPQGVPQTAQQLQTPTAGWIPNAFGEPIPMVPQQPGKQRLPNPSTLPQVKQSAPSDPNLVRASFQAQESAAQKHKELVTSLQYSMYPSAREQAVEGLSRIDWQSEHWVIDALIKSADRDPAATVRAASIRALASMKAKTPEVKSQMEGSLRDIDERVRREATTGLQSFK